MCPGKNANNQRDWILGSRILPDAGLSMEGPWTVGWMISLKVAVSLMDESVSPRASILRQSLWGHEICLAMPGRILVQDCIDT